MDKRKEINKLAELYAKAMMDAARIGGVAGAALMASQTALFLAGVDKIMKGE